jgi:DNA end-binding protein Ku
MARPVWTGSLSFGLVNVPVRLFSATESHRVAFRELEEGTGERIRYKRIAEGSGHEVPWEHIRRGFAVGKDRFVVLTDEELAAAEPERTHTVDIQQFVPLADIDPVAWDQSYYLGPDGPSATKAYVLLREAMRKDGRVAIGRFVMRTKEYVVCVRPLGDVLALQTMFFADEVREPGDVVELPKHAAPTASELGLAARLIESLAGKWNPRAQEDTYRKSVLALVKKKERGETIAVGGEGGKPPKVADLMEALKATLAANANAKAPGRGGAGARGRTRAAPARTRTQARARGRGKGTRAPSAPHNRRGGGR